MPSKGDDSLHRFAGLRHHHPSRRYTAAPPSSSACRKQQSCEDKSHRAPPSARIPVHRPSSVVDPVTELSTCRHQTLPGVVMKDEVPVTKQVVSVNPDRLIPRYATTVHCAMGPEEVILDFMASLNPGERGATKDVQFCRIAISVEHARRLNDLLTRQLRERKSRTAKKKPTSASTRKRKRK